MMLFLIKNLMPPKVGNFSDIFDTKAPQKSQVLKFIQGGGVIINQIIWERNHFQLPPSLHHGVCAFLFEGAGYEFACT